MFGTSAGSSTSGVNAGSGGTSGASAGVVTHPLRSRMPRTAVIDFNKLSRGVSVQRFMHDAVQANILHYKG